MKKPLLRSLLHGALFAATANLGSGSAEAQSKATNARPATGAYSQAVALPAPSTATISPAEIQPTDTEADTEAWQARDVREKRAAAVMTPQATAAQQAQELVVFNETVKRLADVEKSDPARALAQYRRFLVGRNPSPKVGIPAAIKVSQLRERLKDISGSLQTCDLFAKKYANEPSSADLTIQKIEVLNDQRRFAEAMQCTDDAMPNFIALGPGYYREVSELLLQLVQVNLDRGDAKGRERANELCVGVEEIYLRWTKKDAVDHLWQRFEDLKADYEKTGDEKRAEELLPKVSDALLKVTPEKKYVEGAVLSMEAARWLVGQGKVEQASIFYKRVPLYGDATHTSLAVYDQALTLIGEDRSEEARDLILKSSPTVDTLGPLWALAQSYWQLEDWKKAESILQKIQYLNAQNSGNGASIITEVAAQRLSFLQSWNNKAFDLPLAVLKMSRDESGDYHSTLVVHSLHTIVINVSAEGLDSKSIGLKKIDETRLDSGVLVQNYDLSITGQTSLSKPLKVRISSLEPDSARDIELVSIDEEDA